MDVDGALRDDQDDLIGQLKDEINEVRNMHTNFEDRTRFETRNRTQRHEKKFIDINSRVDDVIKTIIKNKLEIKSYNAATKKDYSIQLQRGIEEVLSQVDKGVSIAEEKFDVKLKHMTEWIAKMNQVVGLTSLLDQ